MTLGEGGGGYFPIYIYTPGGGPMRITVSHK
jgi:hypothetical protein